MTETVGLDVLVDVRLSTFHLSADFVVPPGLTVLFGPSGAGKSLTLQAIAGLVPLSNGYVILGRRTLADSAHGLALPARSRRIGYVPQHYALFPHLTVAENIAFGLAGAASRWDQRARKACALRVAELLALVRLDGYDARRPSQLSGGQAQRVALARALAPRPEALLLDEPLGALDAPTRAAVQDDLRRVVIESGVPALVVTHDLTEARTLGDRMVVLAGGSVVATGTVHEVLTGPPTSEAALLLGWRNVVPVRCLTAHGSAVRAEVAGGLAISVAASDPVANSGGQLALALHADRLELALPGHSGELDSNGASALSGTVLAVRDLGAYNLVEVSLSAQASAGEAAPTVAITCSPREWAALRCTVGHAISVHVPDGAARLLQDTHPHPGARRGARR